MACSQIRHSFIHSSIHSFIYILTIDKDRATEVDWIIIIIIILFVQKPKMQQCRTKDMDVEQDTPGSDRQALTVAFKRKNTVTHKYTKHSKCTKHKIHITKAI